jgi:hypothetical protein
MNQLRIVPPPVSPPLPETVGNDLQLPRVALHGSLLPSPAAEAGVGDPLAVLYAAMSKLSGSENSTAADNVRGLQSLQKNTEMHRKEALERAEKEAGKGGFFDNLCDNTGVLGCVGLATFTPSFVGMDLIMHETGASNHFKFDAVDNAILAAGCLTGALPLCAAAIAVRKADCVQEGARAIGLGDVAKFASEDHVGVTDQTVKPAVKYLWIGEMAAIAVTTTAVTAGSGTPFTLACISLALSAGAIAVKETKCMDGITGKGSSEYWAMGLSGASLYFGIGATAAASMASASSVTSNAETVSNAANGASAAASGADKIMHAIHDHDADLADRDAEAALLEIRRNQRIVDLIVDGVREAKDSHQHALQSLRGAIDVRNHSILTAASMRA